MRGCGAVALGLLACWLVACGGAEKKDSTTTAGPAVDKPAPQEEPPPKPVGPALRFDVQPADAEILVDGEAFGLASEVEANGPMSVESGLHQIIITKDGYQTWRAEVAVKDGPETIRVRLDREE